MGMIKSITHKGLRRLFEQDDARRLPSEMVTRIRHCLAALDDAKALGDLNYPGLRVHPLKGRKNRYAMSVNGPWRITFTWEDGDAVDVDLEQYH